MALYYEFDQTISPFLLKIKLYITHRYLNVQIINFLTILCNWGLATPIYYIYANRRPTHLYFVEKTFTVYICYINVLT